MPHGRIYQGLQPLWFGKSIRVEEGDPLATVRAADCQVVSCCESDVVLKADEGDVGEIRRNPVARAILARVVHHVVLIRPLTESLIFRPVTPDS